MSIVLFGQLVALVVVATLGILLVINRVKACAIELIQTAKGRRFWRAPK